jgi:hypothetical protein
MDYHYIGFEIYRKNLKSNMGHKIWSNISTIHRGSFRLGPAPQKGRGDDGVLADDHQWEGRPTVICSMPPYETLCSAAVTGEGPWLLPPPTTAGQSFGNIIM